MASKPTLVVTNPLHFTYFRQQYPATTIGSSHGLVQDYAAQLGFADQLTLFDTANTVQAIVTADQAALSEATSYVAWKAVDTKATFLGNSYELAHALEQKAHIRSLVPAELFPAFMIVPASELAEVSYASLSERLGSSNIVCQIDFSTGGNGTYFVSSAADLEAILPELQAAGQAVVASKRIVGTSRGVQCFIGDQQVFSPAWWHRDLVGIPSIYNSRQPHATKYCGAILEAIPDDYQAQVQSLVEKVGECLIAAGYQGVFGIDIVVDEAAQKIYLIEVNPRFTAVSHLYATAMRAAGYANDFMTAQVANLVGETIDVQAFSQPKPLAETYYYLKLQNQSDAAVCLTADCKMGVYDAAGHYQRFGFGIQDLQASTDVVVIPECAQNISRQSGERVFSIIGSGDPLDQGDVKPELQQYLQRLAPQFLATVQ